MKQNQNKGITLVALVITIVLLLILAGISIATLTGSGLFENARLAEQKSKNAQELENSILSDYESKIGEYVDSSRDTITISKDEYETLKNTISTLNDKFKIKEITYDTFTIAPSASAEKTFEIDEGYKVISVFPTYSGYSSSYLITLFPEPNTIGFRNTITSTATVSDLKLVVLQMKIDN